MDTLDNQEMLIDLGCEILLQFDTSGLQVQGNLIGLEKNDFIIVRPKPLSGLNSMAGKGDRAQALYLCGGTIFSFKSTLVQLIDNPLTLLFLTFPNNIKARPFRGKCRAPALLPASARMDNDLWSGALLDMSRDGLRFACAPGRNGQLPRPGLGHSIRVTVSRIFTHEPLVLDGKIRNIKEVDDYLTLGVKLDPTPVEETATLNNYLDRLSFLNEAV